jgi:hypothetical protein
MNLCFHIIFAPIVAFTKGRKSSRLRKRSKPCEKGWGFDLTLSMRNV